MKKLWSDESGFIVSAEIILVATILVIGLVAGFTTLRSSILSELADVGAAIRQLDQSYAYGSAYGHSSWTAGSYCVWSADHVRLYYGMRVFYFDGEIKEGIFGETKAWPLYSTNAAAADFVKR